MVGLSKGRAKGIINMKTCKRCFKEFDDNETIDNDPISDLGDIFISEMEEV